jgi:RNA recognition motif-containing protein
VGGLSPETTEEDLRAYFQNNYGKVKQKLNKIVRSKKYTFNVMFCVQVSQCSLMFDTTTKRHRGFGFVTLETEDIVDKICEERFHKINDKRVRNSLVNTSNANDFPKAVNAAKSERFG